MYDSQAEYDPREEDCIYNTEEDARAACTDEQEAWYAHQDRAYELHKEREMFFDGLQESLTKVFN